MSEKYREKPTFPDTKLFGTTPGNTHEKIDIKGIELPEEKSDKKPFIPVPLCKLLDDATAVRNKLRKRLPKDDRKFPEARFHQGSQGNIQLTLEVPISQWERTGDDPQRTTVYLELEEALSLAYFLNEMLLGVKP